MDITTWADSFGVWHARVGGKMLGFAEARREAYWAIGSELEQRGDQPQPVYIVADHANSQTGWRTYEFKESGD